MIIKVDNEGKEIIKQLCDATLRIGGIQNLDFVKSVLATIQIIEEEKQNG